MTCEYCKDETCINADCPAYRNYCPCRDYDYIELCKFAEKGDRRMREILFRGKPKNKADYELLKKMYKDNCKDGFIYGSLVVSHGKYYICIMALCQINSLIDNGITTMFEVIPETVGEYTNLTDKNGKKGL